MRACVRPSITEVKVNEMYSGKKKHWKSLQQWKNQLDWWSKTDRRLLMNSTIWLSQRYIIHRELHEKKKLLPDWELAVPWLSYYDIEIINEAAKFLVLEEKERQARKSILSFEVDGIEITGEVEGDERIREYSIVKGEPIEENL